MHLATCVVQVWTYQRRAACVLGVTEHARPIKDRAKLERLRQILQGMVGRDGDAVVTVEQVGHDFVLTCCY